MYWQNTSGGNGIKIEPFKGGFDRMWETKYSQLPQLNIRSVEPQDIGLPPHQDRIDRQTDMKISEKPNQFNSYETESSSALTP